MVDKKLSDFDSVDKANVSYIVVLSNENSTLKNGKLSISTLDQFYDNLYLSKSSASSTYLTKSSASSTYLTKTDASTTYLAKTALNDYLTKTDASSTYLSKTDATNNYLTKSNASNTYVTKTDASSSYLTKSVASSTYLTISNASSTYLSKTDATNNYLTISNASSTYLSKTDASNTYLTKSNASSTYGTKTDVNNKANKNLNNVPSNIDYVIESQLPTSENNYTWYRKYKSGWVEQGGLTTNFSGSDSKKTITLMVQFYDTNYTVLATSSNCGYFASVYSDEKKVDSFKIRRETQSSSAGRVPVNWVAYGQSAAS